MYRFLFTLCLLAAFVPVFAQDDDLTKVTPDGASAKLKAGNYEDALGDYLQLLNNDPKNEQYNYNVAVCYLNSNVNKSKAIPYLEIVVRREKHDPNAEYLLGRAYQYGNRFDDAINTFTKFKQGGKGSEFNLKDVDLQVQHCINAKELMKYPVDVTFQNLGANINSEYNDYYPFVTTDEAFIVYNTKRPEKNATEADNGSYGTSIYISKVINGQYMKGSVLGAPVNAGNNGMEVIGLSSKGDILLLYQPDGQNSGIIYMSKMDKSGLYGKPEKLDKSINSRGDEIAASINEDGSVIYFASDRPGGYGGTDIYCCRRLTSGKWAEPQNLGPDVNTSYDEDFPNISPDGKTLYFSSMGHTSMGGYDIFKSIYNEDQKFFGKARNIGYPVNTTYDDMNFRVSKNGKYGYIASVRPGGQGDYDIYRVTFNDVESDYSVIIGEIKSKDGSPVNYSDVFISVNDNISNELVGNYLPNPANGRFIVILTPGKYLMSIEAPGFKTQTKTIEVFDKVSYQAEINQVVELSK